MHALQQRPEVLDAARSRRRLDADRAGDRALRARRRSTSIDRRYQLRRGVDRHADQSYFLFSLDQAQLARARLPRRRSAEGRRPRATRGSAGCRRRQAGEPRDLLRARWRLRLLRRARSGRPHAALDGRHRRHRGPGRRPRIGACIASPSVSARAWAFRAAMPLYVVSLDRESKRVVVGPEQRSSSATSLVASSVNWIDGEPPRRIAAACARRSATSTPPHRRRSRRSANAARVSTSTHPSPPSRPARPPSSTTATR